MTPVADVSDMIINETMYNEKEREYLMNLIDEALKQESAHGSSEDLSNEDGEVFCIDEDELKPLERLLVIR
ncbi:hypothetical protein [Desulfoferrobacter suflitae]|uniref:hypothetical protein n=1 Tax=Desulfoferrobacter suflitae TaxID=2865782 RepID=UPI002164A56D|nr:hypothetical protein [Desulfoferrobacter suflitae]MCK8603791.1 hypothetical protein [Desulfoferrobacter suflitae]